MELDLGAGMRWLVLSCGAGSNVGHQQRVLEWLRSTHHDLAYQCGDFGGSGYGPIRGVLREARFEVVYGGSRSGGSRAYGCVGSA